MSECELWVWHGRVSPTSHDAIPHDKEAFALACLFYKTHDVFVAAPTANLAMCAVLESEEAEWGLDVVYLQRKEKLSLVATLPTHCEEDLIDV